MISWYQKAFIYKSCFFCSHWLSSPNQSNLPYYSHLAMYWQLEGSSTGLYLVLMVYFTIYLHLQQFSTNPSPKEILTCPVSFIWSCCPRPPSCTLFFRRQYCHIFLSVNLCMAVISYKAWMRNIQLINLCTPLFFISSGHIWIQVNQNYARSFRC